MVSNRKVASFYSCKIEDFEGSINTGQGCQAYYFKADGNGSTFSIQDDGSGDHYLQAGSEPNTRVNYSVPTESGVTYDVEFDLVNGPASNFHKIVYDCNGAGQIAPQYYVSFDGNNHATFSFTASSNMSRIKLLMYGNQGIDNLQVCRQQGAATGGPEFLADIKTYNDYYPFGMMQPGRVYNSPEYRYGFQGEEKDDEIKGSGNSVSFKYRMQDSRLGRFFSVDPLASKYPHYSPYSFSGNKVIHRVEIEGLEDGQISTHSGDLGIRLLNENRVDAINKGEFLQLHKAKSKALLYAPVIGDVNDFYEVSLDLYAGNYNMAAVGALGFVPYADGIIRPVKAYIKASRGALRTALKITDRTMDAHHIIPKKLIKDNAVVQKAIDAGFDFNGEINGIAVKKYRRATNNGVHANHPNYTNQIKEKISEWAEANPDYTPTQAKEFLDELAKDVKEVIQKQSKEGSKKINDINLDE